MDATSAYHAFLDIRIGLNRTVWSLLQEKVAYIILLLIGMGIITCLFEIKGIENNTMPAIKLSGIYILGVLIATIGFLIENNNIKKWQADKKISDRSKFISGEISR